MKINKLIYLLLAVFIFSSCEMTELFKDKNTTNKISKVSVKPYIEVIGDPIISMQVGATYEEKGVNASEVELGQNDLNYEIIAGNVDPNAVGFYMVTYKATNSYGWVSYAFRSVLVYDTDAYGTDIAGTYKLNGTSNLFEPGIVTKYSINGYWQITNLWQESGVVFPAIFADSGDNTYGIVPSEHPSKGLYGGTGLRSTNFGKNVLTFYLTPALPNGLEPNKFFVWKQI